jgi:hypothetical protein
MARIRNVIIPEWPTFPFSRQSPLIQCVANFLRIGKTLKKPFDDLITDQVVAYSILDLEVVRTYSNVTMILKQQN